MEADELEIVCNLADELAKIREQIENFNVLKFDRFLDGLSEINGQLKKISDSLELMSNN